MSALIISSCFHQHIDIRLGFDPAYTLLAYHKITIPWVDDLMFGIYTYKYPHIFGAVAGETVKGLGHSWFNSLVFILCECVFIHGRLNHYKG